ncbi:MAG: chromosomal replication initiator protein DnaA [Bowdeniella nasicola]|nr:chromosomal replication initiator protein DnaA [Bowdeniella nasicola]
MDLNELWDRVIQHLEDNHDLPRMSTAFVYLARPAERTSHHLIIEVPSELVRDHLETHVRDALAAAVASAAGEPLSPLYAVNPELETMALPPESSLPTPTTEVKPEPAPAPDPAPSPRSDDATSESRFTEDQPQRPPVTPPAARPAVSAPQQEDPSRLNPKYTFDTFVTGASNRFAQAAATAVAESPAKAYNPLFIYGGSGLGKTHLLHAIGHYTRRLYDGILVKYVNSEEFTNDFINSIRDDKAEDFQRRYRNVDVLLIDDIQFLGGKEQTVEEFFHTFNTLHNDSKQVIITSDMPPKQLEGFEERLISRFEWGLLTDVQPPDLETRIAILRKKAQAESLRVEPDVLEYIATRIVTNIRELEGALIRVTAFATLNQAPVDLALAELVLKDVITDPASQEITPEMIMVQTAKYFNISVDSLRAADRTRQLVTARQIAMYLCRELTELSLPKIGDAFLRDHTTVMHAYRKITGQMAEKRHIYQQVEELTLSIRQQAMRQP